MTGGVFAVPSMGLLAILEIDMGRKRKIDVKKCVICGKVMRFDDFKHPHMVRRKVCSAACHNEALRMLAISDGRQSYTLRDDAVRNKALALWEKPGKGRTARGSRNAHAKDFQVVSPYGETFTVHNLRDWVCQNAHLFDAADTQWKPMMGVKRHCVHRDPSRAQGRQWCRAYNGLQTVVNGRRRSWKGWTGTHANVKAEGLE